MHVILKSLPLSFLILLLGYRHIDSAEAYRNEEQVGFAVQRAINEGLVKREDLFLATKLSDEVMDNVYSDISSIHYLFTT